MTGNNIHGPNDPPNTFTITPGDANPYGRARHAAEATHHAEHHEMHDLQHQHAEALADVRVAIRELKEAGVPPERTIEVLKPDRVSGIPLAILHPLEHSRTRIPGTQFHPSKWLGRILTRGAAKVAGDSVTAATYADGQEHHGNITPTINKRRTRVDERIKGWVIKDFLPEDPGTLALRRTNQSPYRDRDLVIAIDGRSWAGYQIPAGEDPESGIIGVGDSRSGNFSTTGDRAIERITGIGNAKADEIPPQITKLESIARALRAKIHPETVEPEAATPPEGQSDIEEIIRAMLPKGPLSGLGSIVRETREARGSSASPSRPKKPAAQTGSALTISSPSLIVPSRNEIIRITYGEGFPQRQDKTEPDS